MKKGQQKKVLLVAGGTGGHLFPALSTVEGFTKDNIKVHLITDKRALKYFRSDSVNIFNFYTVASGSPLQGSIFKRFKALASLLKGFFQSLLIVLKIKPGVIIGFGGYPTIPPILVGYLLRIPIIIHEQNLVIGKVNNILGFCAEIVTTGFQETKGVNQYILKKIEYTGNPVRQSVVDAAKFRRSKFKKSDKVFNLCIIGGSQGSSIFSQIIPQAISLLAREYQEKFNIVQQVRTEDQEMVNVFYRYLDIKFKIASFFEDLPMIIAKSNLVIARSGALTVTELSIIGCPVVLVPLPGAQEQLANAKYLSKFYSASYVLQQDFSSDFVMEKLLMMLENKQKSSELENNNFLKEQNNPADKLVQISGKYFNKHNEIKNEDI